MRTEKSQFTHLQTRQVHDYQEFKDFFTKCLEKQTTNRYNFRKQKRI